MKSRGLIIGAFGRAHEKTSASAVAHSLAPFVEPSLRLVGVDAVRNSRGGFAAVGLAPRLKILACEAP